MSTPQRRVIERLFLPWARAVLWLRRPLVIGITGSVGKTTTKDMIGCLFRTEEALARYGEPWVTCENLNSTVGVPLTILGWKRYPPSRRAMIAAILALPFRALLLSFLRPYPRVLVLEYAAGPKGNVGLTSSVAPPDVAVVTAVGPTHLDVFASEKGVAEAKAPLVRNAREEGLVILGEENPLLDWMESQAHAPVVRVRGRGRDLSAEIARVIARHFGFSTATVASVLDDFAAVPGRLNVIEAGNITLIDDAYSANPLSMRLALDTLARLAEPRNSRRIAVLGTMAELGPRSDEYHVDIAAYARERADIVIGIGEAARGYDPDYWCADSDEGSARTSSIAASGDVILVKGSHSLRMTRIVRHLRTERTKAPALLHRVPQ